MKKYEFTFIVADSTPIKKLEEVLKASGGKKLSEKPWGTRMFAYPINKITSGEYHTWQIEMELNKVADFKQKLIYDNVLIRYLMLENESKLIQK